MIPRCTLLAVGRRSGGYGTVGLSRGFASRASLLGSASIQNHSRLRPALSESQRILLAPGSTRNFWWTSSKVAAIVNDTPKADAVDGAAPTPVDGVTAAVQPPAEVATLPPVTPAIPPVDSLPLPPDVPVDSLLPTTVTDAVANLTTFSGPPPPLHIGDLAALGLGGWWPSGICCSFIEAFNIYSGLPWFWTIVGATVISRVALLPFALMGLRNAARMAPFQADFAAIRDEIMDARASGDPLRMNRAMLKQKVIYEKSGVTASGMFLPTLVQVPVTLGMFFGVKHMCDLPVEQLKYSGFDLLPDLTAADPTWILPIAVTAAINLQLTLSVRDMTAASASAGHMINGFRVMTLIGLPFMHSFPSGTMVYIISGVAVMTLQSALLRLPAVRKAAGIPPLPKNMQAKSYSMMESFRYAIDAFRKRQNEARDAAKRR